MSQKLPPARALRVGRSHRDDPPPRRLPVWFRWSVRLHDLGAQLAWFVTFAGVVGATFVVPKIELHPPHYTEVTQGLITNLHGYFADYTFFDTRGVVHVGSGKSYGLQAVGDHLSVYFDPDRPDRSTTTDLPFDYGPGSLGVLALPFCTLVIAALFMRNRKRLGLLRYGREIMAQPFERLGESAGRTVYLTFAYEIEGTTRKAELTTLRREADVHAPEPVLYDTTNPDNAVPLADLPGRPRIVNQRFAMTTLPLAAFLLPGATLAMVIVLVVKSL